MQFNDNDVVRLKRPLSGKDLFSSRTVALQAGEIGTVIDVRDDLGLCLVDFLQGYPKNDPVVLSVSYDDLELIPEAEWENL